MLTRTAAADYQADGIHMNSVDTGWVTDEDRGGDRGAEGGGASVSSAAGYRGWGGAGRGSDHRGDEHGGAYVGAVPEGLSADGLVGEPFASLVYILIDSDLRRRNPSAARGLGRLGERVHLRPQSIPALVCRPPSFTRSFTLASARPRGLGADRQVEGRLVVHDVVLNNGAPDHGGLV